MSTSTILIFAMGVFVLMMIGVFLTMIQFKNLSDDPSIRKGDGSQTTDDK